ncbi:YciI family protein [Cysteiniphilum halobium]|uniref:YciI family protein n=1 Tax=Cysteiniphilum halobium TaxID=2219059 RepID=UPI003F83EE69
MMLVRVNPMKQIHIITITYTAPAEIVDQVRSRHRTFLDRGYEKGLFIASGPNGLYNGGVILASGNLEEIKVLLQEDPFITEKVASYSYHSFDPVKHAKAFSAFV